MKSIRDISLEEFTKLLGYCDYSKLSAEEFCSQVEITYIGRVKDVLKVIVPLTSDELLLYKIFGVEDKNVVPRS